MKYILLILLAFPLFIKAQVPILSPDSTYRAKAVQTGTLVVDNNVFFPSYAGSDTTLFAQFDTSGKLTLKQIQVPKGITIVSYDKNITKDSTILLLSDGTRYASKDSIGITTIPNLQQVTTQGNITNQNVYVQGPFRGIGTILDADNQIDLYTEQVRSSRRMYLRFKAYTSTTTLRSSVFNAGGQVDYYLPNNIPGGYTLATINDLPNLWNLSGNTGTTSSNFLGTTDNNGFTLKTNNIYAMSISNTQRVNIAKTLSFNTLDSTGFINVAPYSGDPDAFKVVFGSAANAAAINILQAFSGGGGLSSQSVMKIDNRGSNPTLYFNNNGLNPVVFKNNGTNGFNNENPIEAVDVIGNINLTGSLKFNGIVGTAGQVPVSNGSGGQVWSTPSSTSGGLLDSVYFWKQGGNAISGSYILGTTNTKSLSIVTNGIERIRVDSASGKVGIGTAPNSVYSLSLGGNLSLGTQINFNGLAANFNNNGQGQIITDLSNIMPIGGGLRIGAGNNASVSTMLEVVSTTKGFLAPSMTTTQRNAIASPADGLQVYDITIHNMCFYSTGIPGWRQVTTTAAP